MNNLKITARLAISIIFLLLALAIILHAYIGTISSHIDIAQQEKNGIAYLRPILRTLDALGDQYALKLRMESGEPVSAELESATAAVTASFVEWQETDKKLGAALEFTPDGLRARQREHLALPVLLKKWQAIAGSTDRTADSAQYGSLIQDLNAAAMHTDETSMLTSDPDICTFYLMEATVMELPDAIAHLMTGTDTIYRALAKHAPLDAELKNRIWAMDAILEQDDIAHVNAAMRTSYNKRYSYYDMTEELKAATEGKLADYDKAGKALDEMLHKMVYASELPKANDFLSRKQAARKAANALSHAGIDQLDLMLSKRIDHFTGERNLAMLKAAIAIAIALGFFWYVTHGITSSLKKLQKAMGEVGGGNFEYEVPCLDHRDEIGSIARTLELFRKSYWWLS